MEFTGDKTIKLDKEASELDKFVIRFIDILKKYTDYVIVSGYVSIVLGRSRTTEDVDIFILPINKEIFNKLYGELMKKGYWCLNAEDSSEVYNYLTEGLPIRIALKSTTIPNFEIKIAKKQLDRESFNDRIKVVSKIGSIYISSLERQIAFKRYYLKSDKDIEDALHIETLFKGNIDRSMIAKYKKLLEKGR